VVLKITILGTSGGILTATNSYTSILVDNSILLDCGEGTTQKLMQVNSIDSIKTICFSHLHIDHFMGISSLVLYFGLSNRKEELTVIGPSPLKKAMDNLFWLPYITGGIKSLTFKLHVKEMPEITEEVEVQGGYKIIYAETEHMAPAFAYRIEKNGETVCYSGDTRPNQNLVDLANKCDLLICDSTFSNEQTIRAYLAGHCTPSDATKMARDADCKKLVLIHFDPHFKKAISQSIEGLKNIFDREVLMADDLMEVEI
jgi:ribonuclease BN (tRNA processing enzyme)